MTAIKARVRFKTPNNDQHYLVAETLEELTFVDFEYNQEFDHKQIRIGDLVVFDLRNFRIIHCEAAIREDSEFNLDIVYILKEEV